MSCDGNRGKFHAHAAKHKGLQDAFGSAGEAEAALEQIFNTARAKAATGDRAQTAQAEARTRKLFEEMKAAGLKPPTHSNTGLPRKDAQFGYAAVQQTLEAARTCKTLPALARQIIDKTQRSRKLSAVRQDAGGYMRCGNCGRFASGSGGHICPATADSETLGKHLSRRLGVPASAYGSGLDELISQARANGSVRMKHGLTGEEVEVSLDGLPLALATGFSAAGWGKAAQVELADGRIVAVLDPQGMNVVQPSGSATVSAAGAYGLALAPNASMGNATATPPMSYHSILESGEASVSGGQAYDLGHFIGTEYRKRDAQGADIEVNGMTYTVGSRSQDEMDWSSARRAGLEPAPKGGVAVGRTLLEAVGALSEGEVVETGDGRIEVYSADRRELLSVYDPASATAGDTLGSPNASAQQLAGILAHRALRPQSQYDAALATDLARARARTGTPLAAADSAYLVMKNEILAGGKIVNLGGSVSAGRCPKCGRFAGDAHICPNANATEAPVFETPTVSAQPNLNVDVQVDTTPIADALRSVPAAQVSLDGETFAQAMQTAQPSLNVDVQVDTTPIADALRSVPAAQVSLDGEAFAQAMQSFQIPAPVVNAAVSTSDMTELKNAMTQMAQAIESLAKKGGGGGGKNDRATERLAEVAEQLASSLAGGASMPAPVSPSAAAHCPKCGQFMGEDHACPPRQPRQGKPVTPAEQMSAQEHIFSAISLAAPDPYLLNVPESVGGQTYQALAEFIPEVDQNFEINEQSLRVMRMMSAMIQQGAGKEKSAWTRAFGLFGPAGTGKNTIARQLAASLKTVDADGNISQGVSYAEANITPESSMQELIGTTVLEKDPESGATISRTRLGKIGLAAAMGSVVCVNEIVRNPKLATALQSMIEDGEIQIDSPEQGMIRIPVHPSTVFVMTWNPGYEGDSDRPGQAPLSRMMPFRIDQPSAEEQERRVESFFASLRGEKDAVDSISARRSEILSADFSVPRDITPSREEIGSSVRFFNEISALAGSMDGRALGLGSDTSTAPGQRQLNRFIALGKAAGWENALETLKVVCDQDAQFESQWRIVRERFEAHFGVDGGAMNRAVPDQD